MPTITITPSTYYLSNSNYLSVSNAANMYDDCDSTTYATITNSRTSTSSYYIYLRGFDLSQVPSDAIVSDVAVRVKARHSGGYAQAMYLYDGTSTNLGSSSTTLSTTATTHTINITHDWADLVNAGSDLGIRINCRRSSRNTTAYVYVYGAEIEVTYTVPVYHTVTITGDTTPTGTQTVLEGTSLPISYVGTTKPTVTDNGVDVTSQVTESTGGSSTYVPTSGTTSNFTVSNLANAYDSADSTNSATLEINGGSTTGTCDLSIPASLPSGATVQSVACHVTLQFSRNNSSSGFTSSVQMYSGSTAKGSATTWVSSATDVAKTTYDLSVGSWTASELASAKLHLTATNNASSTHRFVYVYGVSLVVTYSVSGKVYTYALANIVTDHTVVFTAGSSGPTLYVKDGSAWLPVTAAYRKVSGAWQQVALDAAFASGTRYRRAT